MNQRRGHPKRAAFIIAVSILLSAVPFVTTNGAASSATSAGTPAYVIIQHSLPTGSTQPSAITTDSSGNIWFTEQGSDQVGEYNTTSGDFNEYSIPTPNSIPEGIAVDSRGNVWFAELQPSRLGELVHGTSSITEYVLPPDSTDIPCGPIGVSTRLDGTVWVTCEFSNQIDEVVPGSSGHASISEFNLPIPFSAPLQILFNKGGDFWFTAADANMIGFVTVGNLRNGTSNGINEFAPINDTYRMTFTNPLLSAPITSSLVIPSQIALSPDGNTLWITEHGAGTFDRYDISSKTLVKYWTTRPLNPTYPDSLPNGIAVDSAGIVWMTEHYGNSIARFDPQSESLTEYPIPCCNRTLATTLYLALGNGGSVWFTEFSGNAIGELAPSTTNRTEPLLHVSPQDITLGPTGAQTATLTATQGSAATTSSEIDLYVAGVTPEGSLENLTASFTPSVLALEGENSTGTLTLTSTGLRPGIYYLTVSGRLVGENVTVGIILRLTVTGAQSEFPAELLYVLTGLGILAATSALLIYRRRSSAKRT
jgi:virginiamycin B lyase